MSDTLDSQILSALVFMGEAQTEYVSVEEQKRYLRRWINSVSIEDRKSVGNVIVANNRRDALRPCADGTIVDLDNIGDDIVRQMYDLMVSARGK